MNRISCGVLNCVSNCGDKCCRGSIRISGKRAENKCDTCCESFSESRGDFQNSLYGTGRDETDISCDAESCAYNRSGKCGAERVTVCGGGSSDCSCTSCGTFKRAK